MHTPIYHLLIIGDGFLKPQLEKKIEDLKLTEHVILHGQKDYCDLPFFYSLAKAFILPSTTEQWGLVVNEAMASGLPVIVSSRCGCVENIVKDGINGFIFDPYDEIHLSELMLRIASNSAKRGEMGNESLNIIRDWGPNLFANNIIEISKVIKSELYIQPSAFNLIFLFLLIFLKRFER